MDKVKGGRYIKVLLTLLLTWFYASITGFSPAVCRAAFMISIIATAQGFNRYTNIYNSIAVSLFFLLLFNPYLLVDVGFQLSYLAVLGIIYFQPKIYRWIKLDNWLLNQLWLMSSVSIAAQLVTFPLSVYYFHQFPNYFWLLIFNNSSGKYYSLWWNFIIARFTRFNFGVGSRVGSFKCDFTNESHTI